jgi:hypothetical protein
MVTQHKCQSGQIVKIENGCGCIFCDLDLERHQTTTMTAPGQEVGFFHQTKHGDVPCTAKQ